MSAIKSSIPKDGDIIDGTGERVGSVGGRELTGSDSLSTRSDSGISVGEWGRGKHCVPFLFEESVLTINKHTN